MRATWTIVAEAGGLFIKYSHEKVKAILEAAGKDDAKGLQIAAHSLKSGSAYIGAMRLSALAKELEMMGRSGALEGARGCEESARGVPSGGQGAGSGHSWLRPAAEAR